MGFLNILVYIAISFFIGGSLIGLAVNPINLVPLAKYLQTQILSDLLSRSIVFLSGVLLILFCMRYLQRVIYRRERSVVYESEYGKVSVTLLAVEDMIRSILENTKELTRPRVRVYPRKRNIEVIIRGNLLPEVNFVEFTRLVQERVKDKVQALLGTEKEIRVRIEIKKVVFEGKKNIKETEPEVPFRYYET
jgi:hypothetical protein